MFCKEMPYLHPTYQVVKLKVGFLLGPDHMFAKCGGAIQSRLFIINKGISIFADL